MFIENINNKEGITDYYEKMLKGLFRILFFFFKCICNTDDVLIVSKKFIHINF